MIYCRYSRDRLYQKLIDIYSRKGAKNAKNFDVYLVLTPNSFAYFTSWWDLFVFFSQRRKERRENCVVCCPDAVSQYPRHVMSCSRFISFR